MEKRVLSKIFSRRAFQPLILMGITAAINIPAHAQMNPALQMELGNPSRTPRGIDYRQLLLIKRPQYALVYSNIDHFPTWVAWHLSRQDMGDVKRGQFAPDPVVAELGYTVIMPSDYTGSGYDRGHNCPSADRTASVADNNAVFLMTNITPQARGLNTGPWKNLESYSRRLADEGNELFIYCGHGFSSPTRHTISENKIAVPDFGWKIVVVVPTGEGDPLRRITPATRVIAVKMPNTDTLSGQDWREYRVRVSEIEKTTGLVFFDALPKATAAALKDRVDSDRSATLRRNIDDQQRGSVKQAWHFWVLFAVVFMVLAFKGYNKRNSMTKRLIAIIVRLLMKK